jgi:hypothetical protein
MRSAQSLWDGIAKPIEFIEISELNRDAHHAVAQLHDPIQSEWKETYDAHQSGEGVSV